MGWFIREKLFTQRNKESHTHRSTSQEGHTTRKPKNSHKREPNRKPRAVSAARRGIVGIGGRQVYNYPRAG
jgi:hypothetical protein